MSGYTILEGGVERTAYSYVFSYEVITFLFFFFFFRMNYEVEADRDVLGQVVTSSAVIVI